MQPAGTPVVFDLEADGKPPLKIGRVVHATDADPVNGEALFLGSCGNAYCHGADGVSGSADLSEAVPRLSDEELSSIIAYGTGYMPAPGYTGSDSEDIIAYLRATFP